MSNLPSSGLFINTRFCARCPQTTSTSI